MLIDYALKVSAMTTEELYRERKDVETFIDGTHERLDEWERERQDRLATLGRDSESYERAENIVEAHRYVLDELMLQQRMIYEALTKRGD